MIKLPSLKQMEQQAGMGRKQSSTTHKTAPQQTRQSFSPIPFAQISTDYQP